jgi:FeS assembly SUF system protein
MTNRDTGAPSLLDMLDPARTEGMTARAGSRLALGETPAPREAVVEAVRKVYDPEIPLNVYDLGLIYELDINSAGDVYVVMTLTAPSCPVAGEIPKMVAEAITGTAGVGTVSVTLTWTPPWSPEKMSEDARLALGVC